MTKKTIEYGDDKAFNELLVGRKVTAVTEDTLVLDDSTVLTVEPNIGGCSCGAGDYWINELNSCDNIITKAETEWSENDDYNNVIRLFVYAENKKINLIEVEGNDGSGYYGSGYEVAVRLPSGASND